MHFPEHIRENYEQISNSCIDTFVRCSLQENFHYSIGFENTNETCLDLCLKESILTSHEFEVEFFGKVYSFINESFKFFSPDGYTDISFLENLFDINVIPFALSFIFISLFFKLSLVPFHLWAPDVYEGSPSSSAFFFAVVSKLGIFVLLLRIVYYSFSGFIDSWRYYIILVALASVLVGSFVGLEQKKIKSLLAYSSIGHMGYSLLAFSTGTVEGVQMLYLYLLIYMLSSLSVWSIFLLFRLKNKYTIKQNKELGDFVLLSKSNSFIAFFFAVSLFSIAGIPPFIGFVAKSGIFLVLIESSLYFAAAVSILCSVISSYFYLRIIKVMYFENVLVGKLYWPIKSQNAVVVAVIFLLLLFLFINPVLLYLFTYKISLSLTNATLESHDIMTNYYGSVLDFWPEITEQ